MRRLRNVIMQGNQPEVRHGHHAVFRIRSEGAQPLLVLQALDSVGVAKGVKLLQVNLVEPREFVQHATGGVMQGFFSFHKIAGQCHLQLCLRQRASIRSFLTDEQELQPLAIKTKQGTINAYIHGKRTQIGDAQDKGIVSIVHLDMHTKPKLAHNVRKCAWFDANLCALNVGPFKTRLTRHEENCRFDLRG